MQKSQVTSKKIDVREMLLKEKLPQKTLKPVAPEGNASDWEKKFYAESEWLQPVLNRTVGGERFRFHELNTHQVSLGTFDGPEVGRTFEVSYGAAIVGEVCVAPISFSEPESWAELRIQLSYPTDYIEGEEVHNFLSRLVTLTQSNEDTIEGSRDDPRASSRASKAMVEAIWNYGFNGYGTRRINLRVQGPWQEFKAYVEHWKKHEIDPWEKWERQGDS